MHKKSIVVSKVYDAIRYRGGRFLTNYSDGQYAIIDSEAEIMIKVAQCFRDEIKGEGKTSRLSALSTQSAMTDDEVAEKVDEINVR